MDLLAFVLRHEVSKLSDAGVRLHFPGDRSGLSDRVVQGLTTAEASTAHNRRLVLNVCFNYGGRWDIAQAARRLVAEGREITEESLNEATALAHVGDPDLLIRTGGEMRISNFLLWQSAYTELVFSPCLWPDFDAAELDRALGCVRRARAAFWPDRRADQARPPGLNMLRQRIITALLLLAVLLPALFYPRIEPFGVLSLLLISAAGWEWARLNGCRADSALLLGAGLGFALLAFWAVGGLTYSWRPLWLALVPVWVLLAVVMLTRGVAGWGVWPAALAALGWAWR